VAVTTKLARLARRTCVVLLAGGLVVALAGPAGADVPEGWDHPGPVDPTRALLFVVITLAVLLPPLLRGERFTPGGQATADQWFGGPRQGTAALPAPDDEESKAGGASARW
jgi:hypothetical protein